MIATGSISTFASKNYPSFVVNDADAGLIDRDIQAREMRHDSSPT
jgi:hypothetical protein